MNKQPEDTDLDINLNSLETDAQSVPGKIYYWGQQLAEAKKAAKVAKNRTKLLFAELDSAVRANPGDYDIVKITEGAIKSNILQQAVYKEAQLEQIQREYDEDVLDAYVQGLNSLDNQIANLTKLHGQMYWQKSTTVSAENAEAVRTAQQAATAVDMKPRSKRNF